MEQTVQKEHRVYVKQEKPTMKQACATDHREEAAQGTKEDDASPFTGSLCAAEVARVLKKAYRKIDLRLLTWYALVDLLMKVGEHNITNAAIMNIEEHTDIKHQLGKLSSEQWAIVLSMYDDPHLILEPAAALLMKKFTPRRWMCGIFISWGAVSMCQGALQNFGGLMALRGLLGLGEAGFLPGVIFHLSFWYPTDQLPMRIACIYATSQLAGTFSGLFAFPILFLIGRLGLAGWRYLFILEGAPVFLCGIFAAFFLPNYLVDARFLTKEERTALQAELSPTQPHSDDKIFSWKQAKALLKDPVTYSFLMIWIGHSIGCKGLLTVLPTIIYELVLEGDTTSQLMTMPPYIVGSASLLAVAYLIQKKRLKSWVVSVTAESLAWACYIALVVVRSSLVKYLLVAFAAILSSVLIPVLWPERIRASHGSTRAGLAIGVTSAASGLHGILGPQLYQSSFGPTYMVSFSLAAGLACLANVCIAITWAILSKRERRAAEAPAGSHSQSVIAVEES